MTLEILEKAVEGLLSLYRRDYEVMEDDERRDLMSTIDGLKEEYCKTYKGQLTQFINHLQCPPDGEAEWKQWAEQPYIISHGNISVKVDNDADVYERLLMLLKDHRNNLL